MPYDGGQTYTFAFQAVQEKAPRASGVYTLFTARKWVYVGEADDIQQSLFHHLNAPDPRMARCGPLSFSFETAPAAERGSRQRALVAALAPVCNTEQPPG
jgi:hypothetical protein